MTMAFVDTTNIISEKPVVVFDGSCDFCRRRAGQWQDEAGDSIAFIPSQEAEQLFPVVRELPLRASVHLIEPSGRISCGAQAIFRMRKIAAGRSLLLWLYEKVPGVRYVAEIGYRLVARHRRHLA